MHGLRVASLRTSQPQPGLFASVFTTLGRIRISRFVRAPPPAHVSAPTYFTTVWTLRTPRGPPRQKLPDAPENQQRQLREVRDETAAPRLAVRF